MQVSTRFSFKDFQLTWLSDTNDAHLSPLSLYPDLTPELAKEAGQEKGIEGSVSVFLLECEGKKALFDTGFGSSMPKGGKLAERLSELKIKPDDIDYVFITHFHLDHIAGLVKDDKPAFKNAKIYVAEQEYDAWLHKTPQDKNQLQVKVMKICEKNLVRFKCDDALPLGLKAVDTSGHTPGHVCYVKENLIIIGDLIHAQAIQFDHPEICAVYDADKDKAVESRKKIIELAKEKKYVIAGMHLKQDNSSVYKRYAN